MYSMYLLMHHPIPDNSGEVQVLGVFVFNARVGWSTLKPLFLHTEEQHVESPYSNIKSNSILAFSARTENGLDTIRCIGMLQDLNCSLHLDEKDRKSDTTEWTEPDFIFLCHLPVISPKLCLLLAIFQHSTAQPSLLRPAALIKSL